MLVVNPIVDINAERTANNDGDNELPQPNKKRIQAPHMPPSVSTRPRAASANPPEQSTQRRGWRSILRRRSLRLCFSTAYFDLHLHPRAEPVDHRHQAFDADAPEIRIADAREVSRINSRKALRLANAQTSSIKRFYDRSRQDRL